MKKFLIIFFILAVGTFLTTSSKYVYFDQKSTSDPIINKQNTILPSKTIIPKIGVDAKVEQVGQDSQGRMDIPQNYKNVGWYKLGIKPGEKGNAVIDGHIDTPKKEAGVFYRINELVPGDVIYIKDSKNKTFTFFVTKALYFDYDKVPIDEVFGKTEKFRLNLVTCAGKFDKLTKNYSQRLVVFSELQ